MGDPVFRAIQDPATPIGIAHRGALHAHRIGTRVCLGQPPCTEVGASSEGGEPALLLGHRAEGEDVADTQRIVRSDRQSKATANPG